MVYAAALAKTLRGLGLWVFIIYYMLSIDAKLQ